MIFSRSIFFNITFYTNLLLFLIVGFPFMFAPRIWAIRALQVWARVSQFLLCAICNIRIEIKHKERLTAGPLLVAAKHQSLFETFALLPLFDDPAMVIKRELSWIPLFGWFALKFKMIAVNRSARAQALRDMIRQAKTARDNGRQIIIFPEGTRKNPGEKPDYKPGVAALYGALGLPCVPIALNSGLYWPRRQFIRNPGIITIEILEPIKPGLKRADFMRELENRIETATNVLENNN